MIQMGDEEKDGPAGCGTTLKAQKSVPRSAPDARSFSRRLCRPAIMILTVSGCVRPAATTG